MLSRLNGLAWLGMALSLSWSVGAHAAGDGAPGYGAPGDPALGEKKFYTCYGCHGVENYRNAYPDYAVPRLRHQHASYIVAALHEYRNGERPHATMHAQAASLSDQDIEDIAAYLQGPEPTKPSAAVSGKTPTLVAACVACHGENGLGVAAELTPKPPVIAGQHADYLRQALTTYRNGRRKNVVMDSMAQLLKTDEDVRIAAEYFAGQASPLTTATTDSK
ncbi:MAG: c-type cytochrome [Gammaproteobacteria bacterium]